MEKGKERAYVGSIAGTKRRVGAFCQCTIHRCCDGPDKDPSGVHQGRYLSLEEHARHKTDQLRRTMLQSSTPTCSLTSTPSGSRGIFVSFPKIYTRLNEIHRPTEAEERRGDTASGFPRGAASQSGERPGRKKAANKILNGLESVSKLRLVFSQTRQPNLRVHDVIFISPPTPTSPLLATSGHPQTVEVNAGALALRGSVSANYNFLNYERWLLDLLRRIEDVNTRDAEILTIAKDALRDEVLAEWDRIQALKANAWNYQRSQLRAQGDHVSSPNEDLNYVDTGEHRYESGVVRLTDCLCAIAPYRSTVLRHLNPICVASYVIIAVLLLICRLSLSDCAFVLTGLQVIVELSLSLSGPLSPVNMQILNAIPDDPRTVVDTLRLSPSAKTFVCCRRCFALYSAGEYPELCTNRDTPTSRPCNGKLRKEQRVKGRVFVFPVRTYRYQEMKQWVAEMLCRPGMETLLNRDVFPELSSPEHSRAKDIWDGQCMRAFMGPDNTPFVTAGGKEGRYAFSLAYDSFNPFSNKTAGKKVSTGGIYMVCLNLPPEHRYRIENMFLVGIVPGPTEPSLHEINHLLRPLVDDLVDFWRPGVWYTSTPAFPGGRRIRCAVVPLICDLPAARKMAGFASYSTLKFFCSFCNLHRDDINNLNVEVWGTRDANVHRAMAEAWRDAESEEERERIFEMHGIRYTELLRLPYWNPVTFTIFDAMHAIFLNNFKRHCRGIWGMDVKFQDGDGKGSESKTSVESPSEEAIAEAMIVFREGPKTGLGKLPLSLLRAVASEYDIDSSGNKSRLLGRLLDSVGNYSMWSDGACLLYLQRIQKGWFDSSGRLVKPAEPGELPDLHTTSLGVPTTEEMRVAEDFLVCAPTTTSLLELPRVQLQHLCAAKCSDLRHTDVQRSNKKQLSEYLAQWVCDDVCVVPLLPRFSYPTSNRGSHQGLQTVPGTYYRAMRISSVTYGGRVHLQRKAESLDTTLSLRCGRIWMPPFYRPGYHLRHTTLGMAGTVKSLLINGELSARCTW